MGVAETLYEGQPGTTVAVIYTAPASTRVKVNTLLAVNTTATAATITVEHVPSGGTAGTGNMVADAVSVGASAEASLLPGSAGAVEEIDLAPGDTLQASQGTASAVTLQVSGEAFSYGEEEA